MYRIPTVFHSHVFIDLFGQYGIDYLTQQWEKVCEIYRITCIRRTEKAYFIYQILQRIFPEF